MISRGHKMEESTLFWRCCSWVDHYLAFLLTLSVWRCLGPSLRMVAWLNLMFLATLLALRHDSSRSRARYYQFATVFFLQACCISYKNIFGSRAHLLKKQKHTKPVLVMGCGYSENICCTSPTVLIGHLQSDVLAKATFETVFDQPNNRPTNKHHQITNTCGFNIPRCSNFLN